MGLEVIAAPKPVETVPVEAVAQGPTSDTRVWSRRDFELKLGALLSRVAGQGIAQKIIQRELEKAGAGGKDFFPVLDVEKLGISILGSVPNRGKRSALSEEFLSMIKP